MDDRLKAKLEKLEDALLDLACDLPCETDEILQTEGLLLGDSQNANYPMWMIKIIPSHWRDRLASQFEGESFAISPRPIQTETWSRFEKLY